VGGRTGAGVGSTGSGSVGEVVGTLVVDSVGGAVTSSTGESVGALVGDLVGDLVGASVGVATQYPVATQASSAYIMVQRSLQHFEFLHLGDSFKSSVFCPFAFSCRPCGIFSDWA